MLANLTIYFLFLHPFYVSVCEIHFNEKNSALEITHKIFADDVSLHLSAMQGTAISLSQKTKETNELMKVYLEKHFSLTINGKSVPINYLGYELEEDAVWIYQEVKNVQNLQTIRVKNQVLMDALDDQSNIIHFNYKGETRSYQLTSKKRECTFSGFDNW